MNAALLWLITCLCIAAAGVGGYVWMLLHQDGYLSSDGVPSGHDTDGGETADDRGVHPVRDSRAGRRKRADGNRAVGIRIRRTGRVGTRGGVPVARRRCKAIWPAEYPFPALRCQKRGAHDYHNADLYWPWYSLNPARIGAAWPNTECAYLPQNGHETTGS